VTYLTPLSSRLQTCIGAEPSQPRTLGSLEDLDENFLVGFNGRLKNFKILGGPPEAILLDLGNDIIVRISFKCDLENILNLSFLKTALPHFAIPTCCGAFQSGLFTYMFMFSVPGKRFSYIVWPLFPAKHKTAGQRQTEAFFDKSKPSRIDSEMDTYEGDPEDELRRMIDPTMKRAFT
jgi:hypothetical protein